MLDVSKHPSKIFIGPFVDEFYNTPGVWYGVKWVNKQGKRCTTFILNEEELQAVRDNPEFDTWQSIIDLPQPGCFS